MPAPDVRSAATTRVADRGERPAGSELAGQGRQGRRGRRQLAQDAGQAGRRDVGRDVRPVGQQRVREPGERLGSGRPADDDQLPPAGDPAAEGGQLAGGQAVRVDVLPDDPVDRGPRLDPFRQVLRCEAHDEGCDLVLVGRQVEAADEPLGMLGDDRHDQLGAVVGRVGGLDRGHGGVAFHELDLQVLAEGRRLRVEQERLVGLGRQVRGDGEARLALGAAGDPELAVDRRAVVLEVDRDRHPGADPGMATEQHPGLHRRATRGRDRQCRGAQRAHQDGHDRRDPERPAGTRGAVWHERATEHRHPTVTSERDWSHQGRLGAVESCTGRGVGTAAIVRCDRPGTIGVVPRREVPCPRSARSVPFATTVRPSRTRASSWHRRTT